MATATKSVSIRLGLEGKAEVKTGLKEVADQGKATGQAITQGMDQATSAAERQRQVFDRLVQSAKQARQQSQGQSAWATSLGLNRPAATSAGAPSSETDWLKAEAAATQDLATRSATLRAQIDPLGTAQLRMNMAVASADQLLAKKAITETEHAAAVALAAKEYGEAEQALKRLTQTGGLSANQFAALTHSARGFIGSVSAGQGPIQALAMESQHLGYALAGGNGLSGVMALARQGVSALLSPIGLLITGLAGAAAAAGVVVTAFRAGIMDRKELEASLAGVGRAAGISADQMEQVAQATHEAAGMSVEQARKMEEQFAATGKIGGDVFGRLILLVRDYGATTHQNTDDATKDLAAIFADPAKGIDTLIQKVGGIDDKTRQYILTLAAQGDRQQAQLEMAKLLPAQLQKASDQTDGFSRSTHGLRQEWDAVWESIKRTVSTAGLTQQLADLQGERRDPMRLRSDSAIDADIAAVKGKIAEATQAAKLGADQINAALGSIGVGNLARSILGTDGKKSLEDTLASVKKIGDAAKATGKSDALQNAAVAQDALTRAIATYLTPAEKAAALDKVEIDALNDRTPAQRAATAAKREEIEIAGKLMTTSQAASDVDRARAKALADASRAGQQQAKQNALNAKALDAETAATLESARAWLISAAAGESADAKIRAASDAAKKNTDVEGERQRILAQNIANLTRGGGQQARQLEDQTVQQIALNRAVSDGAMTSEDARRALELWNTTRPYVVALDNADAEGKKSLTATIKALTAAYAGKNSADDASRGQQMVEDQQRNIDLIKLEIGLIGVGDDAREQEIAVLQAKSDLLREHVSLTSQEGQEYVANARNAAALNQQLRLADASRQELEGVFDTMASDVSNFAKTANFSLKSFGDLGLDVARDLEEEFLKLSLINPLKNALFGGSAPTMSSVSGLLSQGASWIAGMFHTGLEAGPVGAGQGAARAVPSRLFRNARRMHTGGLVGDEVPIIAKKGEIVGWPHQMAEAFGGGAGGAGDLHIHQGDATIVVQGNVGPDEVAQIKQAYQDLNNSFERRVARTVGEINRRAGIR